MDLLLYDTYTREKRAFTPLQKGKVGVYTCGPTVYDYPHIGNMRSYVFSDILRRVLEYNKFDVTQVINITDVGHLTSDQDEGEDKMEVGARKIGKSSWEVAKFFTEIFQRYLEMLNILPSHILCRATDHIKEQIELINTLEVLGYTYKTSDGIYYNTSKFPEYGELARLDEKGLRPGARVAVSEEKKNPTDFALWKFSPGGIKRQMEWESPWGIGFPGWHIECSAMAMRYLGETLDIHTGGTDHIPVHHTNEIAQSEAVTKKQFVQFWMHNAHLLVEGEKMSKSLGNIFTIDNLVERNTDPLSFRYLLLGARYRTEMNFTWEALSGAQEALFALRSRMQEWTGEGVVNEEAEEKFHMAINDDLNTPAALAVVWEVVHSSNISEADKKATILMFDQVFGLNLGKSQEREDAPQEIQDLVELREQYRIAKEWQKADQAREQIEKLGWDVQDAQDGPRLTKKK
ncbi:MAG: cysteine--tRNA ligase [bacterium]|nr:cysteine--tRNA ligase [bacterium]